VVVYGDVDPVTDDERQLFMAQSGTVQIDSITGTFSGSVSDIVLVEINPATEQPIANGCQTTISSLDFSAAL
jgi:hypothetical protein